MGRGEGMLAATARFVSAAPRRRPVGSWPLTRRDVSYQCLRMTTIEPSSPTAGAPSPGPARRRAGSTEAASATAPALPRRRSGARQRAILEAAAALVGAQGYGAVTIEMIAAHAGAGKQTIYRWWPSKPALYVDVYSGLVPRALLAADTGDTARDLTLLLEALFSAYRAGPAAAILAGLIGAAATDPAAAAVLDAGVVADRGAFLTEPVERGLARGDVSATIDPAVVARTIIALVWWEVLMGRGPALGPADAARIVACALGGAAAVADDAAARRATRDEPPADHRAPENPR